jgi:hypothetical protein
MQIDYQGKKIDVREVEPVTSKEDWNEYRLTSGKVLMVKTVLVRALEATTEKLPNGEPLYLTNTQQIIKIREG